MTDASLPNVQGTQVTEDTHVIITAPVNPEGQQQSSSMSSGFVSNMLNPSPDTGIGIIFTLNNEATSLVDVSLTTIVKPPLLSATTIPLPPTPLITHLQQTPVPTPATVPSSSLQDLPNFGSLFEFDHRLKTLETSFSEFNQTNQFAKAVSSILGIVDTYLANKMYEAVKTTSLSIADSDDTNDSLKALVDAYESDKLILDTYGDTILFKRRRDDKDKDEEPSARSKQGSKRRWAGKEPESTSVPKEKTSTDIGKGISHWGRAEEGKRQQFFRLVPNRESARDVYSKRRIIAVTKLEIVDWHNYKHLDWITVRRDDDKLYKFKEGDFNRLRIQDIEDMLLLLVQGKLTNLTVEERLAFNVSLRMFTRSIVIQRRVEDLQLGVKSYQKKLNLTKPDTYRPDLKRREAYTAYSNPRGFIYQNKDKKNRLMRIDELHKFSDGTLNDVRTALNDRLKGIRMEYLPQTIWRQSDKDKAGAMIQAIDKQLKTRRIMRSLEKFVGGRPYEGDFRLLQRTI
ncbi:hypothetical protein Tco_1054253 [Tanacetum coccineum]|uniref:Uncharacterized protein n=1 Tax=Tanacetum coccineum TaxID=301880 RepID=A0ABQ5GW89_9ASTR